MAFLQGAGATCKDVAAAMVLDLPSQKRKDGVAAPVPYSEYGSTASVQHSKDGAAAPVRTHL